MAIPSIEPRQRLSSSFSLNSDCLKLRIVSSRSSGAVSGGKIVKSI
eukprot:UN23792